MIGKSLLNYRVTGEGYPVVFLHGFLESNSMWKETIPHLKGIKAVLIELPGHGKSSMNYDVNELTIESIATEVWDIINKLKITTFSIVGHSLGGYVALSMKERDIKDQVDKLVLLNSHPWEDSEVKKVERSKVAKIVKDHKSLFLNEAIPNLFSDPENSKRAIDQLIKEAMKMNSDSISKTINAMKNRDESTKIMKSLGDKCLVIQGKSDHLIPYRDMEELTKKYNNRYYLIKDAGHMAIYESKEKVINQIINFLNCLDVSQFA
ncbi:MAG: alpha/beta hydrolase [Brumimicrobium sp.]